MSFAKSVKTSADKIRKQVNTAMLLRVQDAGRTLIRKTPVSTGLLINNWNVGFGVNVPKFFTQSTSTTGSASLTRIASITSSSEFLGKDGIVNFVNITPYAYRAEVLGWPQPTWSGRVGPYAMVRNTITYMKGKYK